MLRYRHSLLHDQSLLAGCHPLRVEVLLVQSLLGRDAALNDQDGACPLQRQVKEATHFSLKVDPHY